MSLMMCFFNYTTPDFMSPTPDLPTPDSSSQPQIQKIFALRAKSGVPQNLQYAPDADSSIESNFLVFVTIPYWASLMC